jgi:signal transduction histidine kinase
MFKSARFKLTLWYFLIIAVISISFSAGIYQLLASELDRVDRLQRTRIERVLSDDLPHSPYLDPLIVAETKDRIRIALVIINLAILGSSTIAGYFLAGRTLEPIEEMVDEQKRFVSDASHELRTPLTSIKTEIEVALRDKKLNLSQSKSLLRSNLEEVDKIQKLSNYLLILNRYQERNSQTVFRKVNLKEIVEKAVVSLKPQAKSKEITITEKLISANVYGNTDALAELTRILLDNAIKYSHDKGKIMVTLKKDGSKVNLRVQDFGMGIKASEIPYIFNRFYRADLSRAKNRIDGFGLGLSIAQNIVKIHKGKIQVNSQPGKGTTFNISFSAFSQGGALK